MLHLFHIRPWDVEDFTPGEFDSVERYLDEYERSLKSRK